jgi:hypothetical protein
MLKIYDSSSQVDAKCKLTLPRNLKPALMLILDCAHSSFPIQEYRDDSRESIEVRALVFSEL